MTEIWLAGAILLVIIAIARTSLLERWWQVAIPALLTGLWLCLTFGEIARQSLSRIYAPLTEPDLLVLILMLLIAESLVGLRVAMRAIDPARETSRWRGMISLIPNLSLFAALRLLAAQAFQAAPAGVDFETFGILLAVGVSAGFFLSAIALRIMLPDPGWRIELSLLLRLVLLIGIFVGYGLVTLQPVPPPDSSFSWKGTAALVGGMGSIVVTGGLLNRTIQRIRRRLDLTRVPSAADDK